MEQFMYYYRKNKEIWPRGNPNQQRTLNKLPPELRCGNFVTKRRPSTQLGRQTCAKRVRNLYIFRLSFHLACRRCWLGGRYMCTHSKCPLGEIGTLVAHTYKKRVLELVFLRGAEALLHTFYLSFFFTMASAGGSWCTFSVIYYNYYRAENFSPCPGALF